MGLRGEPTAPATRSGWATRRNWYEPFAAQSSPSSPRFHISLTRCVGPIPVKVSGGCQAWGHPVIATSLYDIRELVTQLPGEAGRRQVEHARTGMVVSEMGLYNGALIGVLQCQ